MLPNTTTIVVIILELLGVFDLLLTHRNPYFVPVRHETVLSRSSHISVIPGNGYSSISDTKYATHTHEQRCDLAVVVDQQLVDIADALTGRVEHVAANEFITADLTCPTTRDRLTLLPMFTRGSLASAIGLLSIRLLAALLLARLLPRLLSRLLLLLPGLLPWLLSRLPRLLCQYRTGPCQHQRTQNYNSSFHHQSPAISASAVSVLNNDAMNQTA